MTPRDQIRVKDGPTIRPHSFLSVAEDVPEAETLCIWAQRTPLPAWSKSSLPEPAAVSHPADANVCIQVSECACGVFLMTLRAERAISPGQPIQILPAQLGVRSSTRLLLQSDGGCANANQEDAAAGGGVVAWYLGTGHRPIMIDQFAFPFFLAMTAPEAELAAARLAQFHAPRLLRLIDDMGWAKATECILQVDAKLVKSLHVGRGKVRRWHLIRWHESGLMQTMLDELRIRVEHIPRALNLWADAQA